MSDYKVFTAPDGTKLYQSPGGAVYNNIGDVVADEIATAVDQIAKIGPAGLKTAAQNAATADPATVNAIAVLNEVFMQAAIAAPAPAPIATQAGAASVQAAPVAKAG